MTYKTAGMYSGIGGIEKGFEDAGFEIVWSLENDPYACLTYKENHLSLLIEENVWEVDIRKVSSLGLIEVLLAGFPCQSFSIDGKQLGFQELRGKHFFKVLEFIDIMKPRVIFLENVFNITAHDKGRTYSVILNELQKRGFYIADTILNTSTHGNIPQNRKRWFLVGFQEYEPFKLFEFPSCIPLESKLEDFLEEEVEDKFFYTPESSIYEELVNAVTEEGFFYSWRARENYVRKIKSGLCPTLMASMGGGGNNVPILLDKGKVRKLTPVECFNFQGFPDLKLPDISNTQLYKQAGNSVSVPVIYRIAQNIRKALDGEQTGLQAKLF